MAATLKRLVGIAQRVGAFTQKSTAVVAKVAPERAQAFWFYAKVELAPPSIADFGIASKELKRMMKLTNDSSAVGEIPVRRLVQNGLICAEIAFIFFFGEIIGRRSLIGYNPMGDPLKEFSPPPGMSQVLPDFVTHLELNTMYDHGLYHFGPGKNY